MIFIMNIELKKLNYVDQHLLNKILEWRNDENTRQYSNNTNIITPDIFNVIIKKYIESGVTPLIIYLNGIESGIISFTQNNNKIYIGINIAPKYRHMKIGSKALDLFVMNRKEWINNGINVIYASVKIDNIPSIKLFHKYFLFMDKNDLYNEFYLEI